MQRGLVVHPRTESPTDHTVTEQRAAERELASAHGVRCSRAFVADADVCRCSLFSKSLSVGGVGEMEIRK